jgi:hypothetical protein
VNQSAAFSVEAEANSFSLGPNDSASTLLSISSASGFSGSVQLSVSGLPGGVTASFDQNPATTSSNLTLSTGGTITAGTYSVTVTGKSGSLSASKVLTLTLTSTQGNFTVGSSLTAVALQDGTSFGPSTSNNTNSNPCVVTVTSIDNFSGDVALTIPNLPAGMTVAFSPATVTLTAGGSATSVMTLNAGTTTPTGSTQASITGTAGTLTNNLPLLLAVKAAFTVGTTSTSFTLAQGASLNVPVYVMSQNGFSAAVSLTATGLPSGVSASFAPVTITPAAGGSANTTMTLTATSAAVINASTITITGAAGSATASETATLNVTAPPAAFTITSPSAIALNVGQSGYVNVPIEVTPGQSSFTGAVTLSISGLPAGLSASFSPSVVYPSESSSGAISTLTVTANSAAVIGNFTQATITGNSGAITNSLTLYAGASGSLTGSSTVIATGGTLTLNYNVDSDLVYTNNWIGIFAHGVTPQSPTPLLQQNIGVASGAASFRTDNLAQGSYDAWIFVAGSTTTLAGPFTFNVGSAPTFTLTSQPSYLNLSAGNSETVAITVSSLYNFSSAVTLSVSGLPSGVTASFASSTVTPSANGSVAGLLTLSYSGSSSATLREGRKWMPAAALALLLLPFSLRKKRRSLFKVLALCAALAGGLMAFTGCSGTPAATGVTTPTTITITGVSGSTTSTASFSLYVH